MEGEVGGTDEIEPCGHGTESDKGVVSGSFGGISDKTVASANISEEGANYLRFPVPDFFEFFFLGCLEVFELFLPFFLEVPLAASAAGGPADSAKVTVLPFVFLGFVFFGKAPRGVLRAPLPFEDLVVALTIDCNLVICLRSAALASLVSFRTNSRRLSGVTLSSLLTSISASAVAASVKWLISNFLRLILISFLFSCAE